MWSETKNDASEFGSNIIGDAERLGSSPCCATERLLSGLTSPIALNGNDSRRVRHEPRSSEKEYWI